MTKLRTVAELPGPRGLPFLGVAPRITPDALHLHLEGWYREFGGPYTFKLGKTRFVAFGDVDSAREVLKRRPKDFRRGRHMAEIINELGGRGVFTAEGEDWRRQRKLTMPGFNQSQLRRFFPKLLTIVERLHGVWDRTAARPDGAGASWDFRGDFERFTTDVTTALAFGHDVNSVEGGRDLLQADVEQLLPGVNRRLTSAIPLWRYVKLPRERALEAAGDSLRAKLGVIIADARAKLEADPDGVSVDRADTLLEAMIAAELTDEDRERFAHDEIYGNVLTLLLAGEDTTAHTLAWVAHALVSEPGVQARIQAEVDALLEGDDAPGLTALEQTRRLPYLEGVIQEALRLRSVAPLMFYQAYEPVEIGGVRIVPDEVVVLLTRHCAVQDEHFSEASRFWPERWMRSDEANVERCPVHHPKAMMPFGAGPRICPGRGLSLLEMHVVLARLCRNFEVEALGDPSTVRERMAFTMSPVGFELRLRRRTR